MVRFWKSNTPAEAPPDGLTVDAEGFAWSAQVNYGCMLRLDPAGKLERIVTFPAGRDALRGLMLKARWRG